MSMRIVEGRCFSKGNIILANRAMAGDVYEKRVRLWMTPNPDRIKIQKMSKVESCEPEGMIGVWKGVSKDDISEIKLE